MIRRALSIGILVALGLSACQQPPPPKPVMAPPVTAPSFPTYRDSFLKQNPDSRVGLVTLVVPAQRLAAIGMTAPGDFKLDEYVSFFDSQYHFIVNGKVSQASDTKVEVKYDAVGPNDRAPAPGDIAVRIQHAIGD